MERRQRSKIENSKIVKRRDRMLDSPLLKNQTAVEVERKTENGKNKADGR